MGVFVQGAQKDAGIEYVDAHRGAHHGGIEPRTGRVIVLRLFLKSRHLVILGDVHHPVSPRSRGRYLDGCHRDLRPMSAMPVQHFSIIHFVDVVAGQDQGEVGSLDLDALEILKNGGPSHGESWAQAGPRLSNPNISLCLSLSRSRRWQPTERPKEPRLVGRYEKAYGSG